MVAIFGLAAATVAITAGGIAGWAVTTFVMESDFEFVLGSALAVVALGVSITMIAGLAFAWRPLSTRPAKILRHSD